MCFHSLSDEKWWSQYYTVASSFIAIIGKCHWFINLHAKHYCIKLFESYCLYISMHYSTLIFWPIRCLTDTVMPLFWSSRLWVCGPVYALENSPIFCCVCYENTKWNNWSLWDTVVHRQDQTQKTGTMKGKYISLIHTIITNMWRQYWTRMP
jgi:hypothetical protein